MSVEWKEWTGHDIEASLKKAVGQYLRNDDHYYTKIGFTNNPERRWKQYAANKWDKMIVLFKTSSKKFAFGCEDLLIKFIWNETKTECFCCNEYGGKAGRAGKVGPYYVYMVLAKEKPLDCSETIRE